MIAHSLELDLKHLHRAVDLALEAERSRNLPIGCVVTLEGEMIAEAGNAVLMPRYHPGRHAEMEALRLVPAELWPQSHEMTCYTTLEPCLMCMGALVLHGFGRIVFGARDTAGGANALLLNLPEYYRDGAMIPQLVGPLLPELCDALYARVNAGFDSLPCGKFFRPE